MLSTLIVSVCLSASLELPDLDGRRRAVVGDRTAKATVTFVIYKDCPIARKFAPEMARIAADYEPKGIRFYTVFNEAVSVADAKKHLKEFRLAMPGVINQGTLAKLTQAKAVPTAGLFAPSGELLYSGRIDDRFPVLGVLRKPRVFDLRRALDQVLGGMPVHPSRTPVVGCAI